MQRDVCGYLHLSARIPITERQVAVLCFGLQTSALGFGVFPMGTTWTGAPGGLQAPAHNEEAMGMTAVP